MSQIVETARPGARNEERARRSLAEWVTFGVAATILLAIIGLVVYDWLTASDMPPVVAVTRAGEIVEVNGQWQVPFVVENTGGNTAEGVQVVAELRIDGEVVEEGEQQVDFLSGSEREEGAFVFTRDPRTGDLSLRVASYKLP